MCIRDRFISGIGSTLTLAFSGTILGLLIGLIIGAIRAIKVEERDSLISKIVKRVVWFITTVYIEIFRGTPMMVQGAFIYYGLKNIVHWSPFTAGVFVITINTGAYMAEIIRSGIQAVDKGQSEAARSIGMNSCLLYTSDKLYYWNINNTNDCNDSYNLAKKRCFKSFKRKYS